MKEFKEKNLIPTGYKSEIIKLFSDLGIDDKDKEEELNKINDELESFLDKKITFIQNKKNKMKLEIDDLLKNIKQISNEIGEEFNFKENSNFLQTLKELKEIFSKFNKVIFIYF
jgi:predicted  nucleic acid-binding Zn-ribbon protein